MFYILYQVTNTVNGKIYVGVHKTKKLDDGYMGSGKVINSAIKKYGVENFTRVILEQFDDSTAMYAREKEVVTDEFLLREDTYNLRRGGQGGFDYINAAGLGGFKGRLHSDETKAKQGHIATPEERAATSVRSKGNNYNPAVRLHGIDHPAAGEKTEQHIEKIATSISELHKQGRYKDLLQYKAGPDHPMRKLIWVTDGTVNKRISKDSSILEGWNKGRTTKRS